jgi:hypothetical protein
MFGGSCSLKGGYRIAHKRHYFKKSIKKRSKGLKRRSKSIKRRSKSLKKSGGGYGSSGGSSGVTYMGTSIDDDDWDYLPGSSEYRCRSKSSGKFVSDYLCNDDEVEDSWY